RYQRQVELLNDKYKDRFENVASNVAYEAELEALQAHHDRLLREEEDYQRARAELMSDWTNGANRAFDDYIARASDVAGQTYDIFSRAFQGLEDTLVDFVTKGQADWKGFFDSLAADIARFLIRQQLSAWLK